MPKALRPTGSRLMNTFDMTGVNVLSRKADDLIPVFKINNE